MEITPEIIEKQVEAKEKELQALHDRMDGDFKIWDLENVAYEKHKTAINITSNRPRTFADEVQTTLAAAEMGIRVSVPESEGKDIREDTAKLERLLQFALDNADERLRRMMMPPLRNALIWHGNIRGWIAARILVYKDGDSVIFDFLPLDPRWISWEVGANGMAWIAYRTFRSALSLYEEYGLDIGDKSASAVIDYWWGKPGEIKNMTVCEQTQLSDVRTLKLPSMPVLLSPVGICPPVIVTSGNDVRTFGESIYASGRNIFLMYNRVASMMATHANLMAKQPTIHEHEEGIAPIKSTAYYAEGVINLIKGKQQLLPSPVKELSPTVMTFFQWLGGQVEQATLPFIPIGTPPPSGTMYHLAQESGKRVFNPQLRTLEYFYADICRLVEEQLIAGGIKVDVRTENKERKYYATKVTPVDLKKPHIIKVSFTARTPWTELDAYQIADMAKRLGLPDAFIHEEILNIPDPKDISDLSAIEMAEHSPQLAILKAIKALMRRGRHEEAKELIREMYNMFMQEQMGETQGETGEQPMPGQTPMGVPQGETMPPAQPVPGQTPIGAI